MYAFSPSTQEAEAGRSAVTLRLAWSTELVPGMLQSYRENLSIKTKQTKKRKSYGHELPNSSANEEVNINLPKYSKRKESTFF